MFDCYGPEEKKRKEFEEEIRYEEKLNYSDFRFCFFETNICSIIGTKTRGKR